MKRFLVLVIALMIVMSLGSAAIAQDDEIVVYMQMGGNLGDGATLAFAGQIR